MNSSSEQNLEPQKMLPIDSVNMADYPQVLADLFARTADGIKLGLDTTRTLLNCLGSPDKNLPLIITVAGTNGKGSTSTLIYNLLRACGLKVGLFISPHLLQFNERISVNDTRITPQEVTLLHKRICELESQCPTKPTFFECTTVIAACHFAQQKVEAAVFEVGLGGRLDATNAMPKHLAVITPIGLDHQRFLGNSLSAIAAEKAAIIPDGGFVACSNQAKAAMKVIAKAASDHSAQIFMAPSTRQLADKIIFFGKSLNTPLSLVMRPEPKYQRLNVATAIASAVALEKLGIKFDGTAIQKAVDNFSWPGRYHRLFTPCEILLDGAHNPHAISALLNALNFDKNLVGRPMHVVFSALKDKSAEKMLKLLKPISRSLHLCPLKQRRGRTVEEMRALDPQAQVYPEPKLALDGACQRAVLDGGFVLVTGSLYLVAQALAKFKGEKQDLIVEG